jgi:hypothetical protein
MSRGDYVDVTYRTGAGVVTHRISARTFGAKVDIDEGKANSAFVTVTEQNRADEPIQTARFAKGEVVSIIEGHEAKPKMIRSRKPKAVAE